MIVIAAISEPFAREFRYKIVSIRVNCVNSAFSLREEPVNERLKSVSFVAGHGEICPPHGRSTWRPADQPTTRRSTWISCLFKENHTRNPCGSACCGLVCGSPCGSPMWGANVAMACYKSHCSKPAETARERRQVNGGHVGTDIHDPMARTSTTLLGIPRASVRKSLG